VATLNMVSTLGLGRNLLHDRSTLSSRRIPARHTSEFEHLFDANIGSWPMNNALSSFIFTSQRMGRASTGERLKRQRGARLLDRKVTADR